MEWISLATGVLGLIALVLRHFLKQKSQLDKANEIAKAGEKDIQRFRTKLAEGDMDGAVEQMDRLDARVRMLLELRNKKTNSSGK